MFQKQIQTPHDLHFIPV